MAFTLFLTRRIFLLEWSLSLSVTLRVPILNWEVHFMKTSTHIQQAFAENGNKHIQIEGFQSPCLMRNEAV